MATIIYVDFKARTRQLIQHLHLPRPIRSVNHCLLLNQFVKAN